VALERSQSVGLAIDDDSVARLDDFAVWLPQRTAVGLAKKCDHGMSHPTAQDKLCLCAVKDLHSNRIVGYSIDSRMTASLAVAALRNAIALCGRTHGVTVHSDRGSQFRSNAYVRTLRDDGLIGSMGRVGACGEMGAVASGRGYYVGAVVGRVRAQHQQPDSPRPPGRSSPSSCAAWWPR
jgi:hypothetical protein